MSKSIASASIIAMKSASEHSVAFYETEQHLCDIMTTHIGRALRNGEPVVVVATRKHLDNCLHSLEKDGIDIRRALSSGLLTTADAEETILKFIIDGAIDEERFHEVIGGMIAETVARYPDSLLRVFGEMVDVLWRDGKKDLVLRLEDLWNQLAQEFSFHLLCAYYIGAFNSGNTSAEFDHICGQHHTVAPTETYTGPRDDRARLREIAMLQQRAIALEAEIQRSRVAEADRDRLLIMEKAARQEAEHANRVKDDFLAVLSHELRTPLNAIIGWTQILTKQRDEHTVERAVDTIHRNALLQKRLVEDLLDVSRIATGKLAIKRDVVDLNQVTNAAAESVRLAATAKSIDLYLTAACSELKVFGDADRLQQVVWNLLSNAVKFTPSGGAVTVHLEKVDSKARLSISDTGEGIAADFLPHVFDRFRQADGSITRRYGGLGVGLSIVRSLVEAHGGHVSAVSAGKGEGATFVVTLPALT